MNTPSFGETKISPCSWCQKEIKHTYTRYDFCADGFWAADPEHECGFMQSGLWAPGAANVPWRVAMSKGLGRSAGLRWPKNKDPT